MATEVDQLIAGRLLKESLERVRNQPKVSCLIDDTVDVTMDGKGCITYQYILLTALVAKLANPKVDMLSLQAEDKSDGAYSARTLCKDVIYPFQKNILKNVLQGSNSDPLVNKPARYPRLSKGNAARGDGRNVLDLLCDSLPILKNADEVKDTLDYMMTKLFMRARENEIKKKSISVSVENSNFQELYSFLSELLDQGFGGAALVLATYGLFTLQFPERNGYKITAHPVNQSGASSRQKSDLDIELNGEPFLGVELKDKPFSSDDVARASETAMLSGLKRLLFVSGRHTGIASIPTYFAKVRKDYACKGFAVGVIDIDELMDFILVSQLGNIDVPHVLESVYECISEIGGTSEMQTWVYSKLSSLG